MTAPNAGENAGKMVSPRNGAVCPTGHHHPNQGGRKGVGGRKPNEARRILRRADAESMMFLRSAMMGHAVAEHVDESGKRSWDWTKPLPAALRVQIAQEMRREIERVNAADEARRLTRYQRNLFAKLHEALPELTMQQFAKASAAMNEVAW